MLKFKVSWDRKDHIIWWNAKLFTYKKSNWNKKNSRLLVMVRFEFWGCLVVSSFDYLCIIVFTFCTVVILTFYYSVIVMSQLFLHWVTARLFLFPFCVPILSPQSCLLSLSLGLCVHYFLFYFDIPCSVCIQNERFWGLTWRHWMEWKIMS